MKTIFIIAGANGAGKTTFAQDFLPHEGRCREFVNADLIAAGLSPFQPDHAALVAGRLMLERIHKHVENGVDFAFETTLATRNYLKMIPKWQEFGYQVHLFFLKLPDAELAVRRVAQRVELGGHNIPEATIRRRFVRGWENLNRFYIPLVDTWAIYDSSVMPPFPIDHGSKSQDRIKDEPSSYAAGTDKNRPRPTPEELMAGSQAAMIRAAKKAIARARAAGLEPVLAKPSSTQSDY